MEKELFWHALTYAWVVPFAIAIIVISFNELLPFKLTYLKAIFMTIVFSIIAMLLSWWSLSSFPMFQFRGSDTPAASTFR